MRQTETERILADLIRDRFEERINKGILHQKIKINATLRIIWLEPAGIEISVHDGYIFLRFLPHTSGRELCRIAQTIAPGESWEYMAFCLQIPVETVVNIINGGGWD